MIDIVVAIGNIKTMFCVVLIDELTTPIASQV